MVEAIQPKHQCSFCKKGGLLAVKDIANPFSAAICELCAIKAIAAIRKIPSTANATA